MFVACLYNHFVCFPTVIACITYTDKQQISIDIHTHETCTHEDVHKSACTHIHIAICVCVCVCVFSLRPSGFVFGSNGRGTMSRSTKTHCPQKFWHSPATNPSHPSLRSDLQTPRDQQNGHSSRVTTCLFVTTNFSETTHSTDDEREGEAGGGRPSNTPMGRNPGAGGGNEHVQSNKGPEDFDEHPS